MDALKTFLQTQTVIQIAPKSDEPWIANVMMACDEPSQLFFIGSEQRHYGQLLSANGTVAFATAWHAADDHLDRKGVQGVGIAHKATSDEEIALGVTLHNRDYPAFAGLYTEQWVRENEYGLHVWVIKPRFIKFWNDAVYGRDGTETFTFTT